MRPGYGEIRSVGGPVDERYPGYFEVLKYGFGSQGAHYSDTQPVLTGNDKFYYWPSEYLTHDGSIFSHMQASTIPEGGMGIVSYRGTINVVLHYRPTTDRGGTPDPSDVPSAPIYLKVKVRPVLTSGDGSPYGDGDDQHEQTHHLNKEHVEFNVVPGADALAQPRSFTEQTLYGQYKSIDDTSEFTLKIDPQGRTDITLPAAKIFARAWLDSNRTTVRTISEKNKLEWNRGQASVSLDFTSKLTPYFSQISSGIEDSYRKITSASQLPRVYRHSGNQDTYVIDDTQIGYGTKDGSGPGPWGVKCKRGADGSMTVESAANYTGDRDSGITINYAWYGVASWCDLSANPTGFVSPSYSWSLQGGLPTSRLSNSLSQDTPTVDIGAIGYGQDSDNYVMTGINLGGTATAPGAKSSTFQVKITELDAASPTVVIDNTYTINWHSPSDNNKVILSRDNYTDTYAMTTGSIGNQANTQEENGSLEVWIDPSPWQSVVALNSTDWAVIGGTATILTSGSALVVERGAEATIGGLSALSKSLPGFAVAAGSAGASWTLSGPPAAPLKQTIVNNSAEWGQAVSETIQESNTSRSKPCCLRASNPY